MAETEQRALREPNTASSAVDGNPPSTAEEEEERTHFHPTRSINRLTASRPSTWTHCGVVGLNSTEPADSSSVRAVQTTVNLRVSLSGFSSLFSFQRRLGIILEAPVQKEVACVVSGQMKWVKFQQRSKVKFGILGV